MDDGQEPAGATTTQDQPSGTEMKDQPGGTATQDQLSGTEPQEDQPSETEMRAAYEAELNRITSSEMVLQTVVSLLNIGGRRLGLTSPDAPAGERDLEQVRDAIDGAAALMPILGRRMPSELGPLRDAIAQLQVAYAREVQSTPNATSTAAQSQAAEQPSTAKKDETASQENHGESPGPGPGPAQASGRLWVPGH